MDDETFYDDGYYEDILDNVEEEVVGDIGGNSVLKDKMEELQSEEGYARIIFLVFLILNLACFALSFVLNLGTFCTVWANSKLRRYGYYHLVIVFCVENTFYFAVVCGEKMAEFIVKEGYLDQEFYDVYLKPVMGYSTDLAICLAGSACLTLSAMTTDCLMNNCCWRSRCGQRCCRSLIMPLVLISAGLAFMAVLIFRHRLFNDMLGLNSVNNDVRFATVLSLYVGLFVLLPAIVVVIFGTVNWVCDWSSGRAVASPRKAIRRLDHSLLILSVFFLFSFLATILVHFQIEIMNPSDVTQTWILLKSGLWAITHLLFAIYPLVISCKIGKVGCCCCGNSEPSELRDPESDY